MCAECKLTKPREAFYRDSRASDGLHSYCKACLSRRAAERYRRRKSGLPALRPSNDVPAGHKRCPACATVKVVEDFPRNRSARDGRGGYCKPRHSAKGKATYTRLYGGTRHYHLQRRYGISAEKVEGLIKEQGGVCAICLTASRSTSTTTTGQARSEAFCASTATVAWGRCVIASMYCSLPSTT